MYQIKTLIGRFEVPWQIWAENRQEQSATFLLGGHFVVVRPGGCYQAIVAPPEISEASRSRVSEALAAVVKTRLKV